MVKIGNIKMKNPVMLASGTYEYNEATKNLINVKKLGAIVTKTVTLRPQEGNPPPRTCETPSGMLNAIGLQNKGVDYFLRKIYPELRSLKVPIIVSIAGKTANEFSTLAKKLDKKKDITGIELNLSCPNVRVQGPGSRVQNPELEVSGGITLDNVEEYAASGVDMISVGSLTKDVRSFDMALEVVG